MGFLTDVTRGALNILFPPRTTEVRLSNTTLQTFERLVSPVVVGATDALLSYEHPDVQALIWELKYYDSTRAAEICGALLAQFLEGVIADALLHKPLIIPIPLHKKRLQERGYNQCERIALNVLSHLRGQVMVAPHALVRTRNTPRQTELKGAKRKENVSRAFSCPHNEALIGKTCILIDDVITTGATLFEARRALLDAGCVRVIPIALAYARPR